MDTKDIANKINQYMQANSNFDERRNYLGISHVAGCPRRAYFNYINGMEINGNTYRMSFAGYENEKSVRDMLGGELESIGLEVVAPFDNRLRGHIDGAMRNTMIEIKSVTVKRFEKVREAGKALPEHFEQCQLYMRYGNFQLTFIIYRCRETYEHLVLYVPYVPSVAEKMEHKAKRILLAIDDKKAPACECGYCK